MRIEKVQVYGLEESIAASKYPMSVDIGKCNGSVTDTVRKLFSSPTGHGHDQALTGITVQFDLTCTNKMWVEAERYRFFYFVSSQSTMHRITKFDIGKQCNEYVSQVIIREVERLVKKYNDDPTPENYLKVLYNVPSGFELTARMTTNYRQLKTIYQQRKDHPLPEWRAFCQWLETLPMFKELCLGGEPDERA